jgi:RecB family endonuclease NucS
VRLVIARCQVDYAGRLTAHLPMATRLILVKADGSVSIHADDRAYKPLNWMSPPCSMVELAAPEPSASLAATEPLTALWEVRGRDGDTLQISLAEVFHDSSHELGHDPGLQKDGVEAHLQALLAEHPEALLPGLSLVRREHPTPIGPVDLLCRDATGAYVAVEIKRRGEIDGVEQLSRYLELLRRDALLGKVHGIFAAQQIKPQARVLAQDRGITCVTVDYDVLRGMDDSSERLF